MKTVNVHEAKTNFSSCWPTGSGQRNHRDLPQWGAGRRSRATQAVNRIKTHPVLSKIKIGYDPLEPLASDEWPESAR